MKTDLTEYIFPIIGGTGLATATEFNPINVVGTCFSIGNNILMTAGHVVEKILSYDSFAIGYKGPNKGVYSYWCYNKKDYIKNEVYEIFNDVDIGLIYAETLNTKEYKWNFETKYPPENIQTFGFPFSFNKENNIAFTRYFKGYIVSQREFYRFSKEIDVYEVSFPCPKGLSGSFLLNTENEITGVILGNENHEMEIYSEVEHDVKQGTRTSFIKTEVMKLGIAIQAHELSKLYSKLLKANLGNYLKEIKPVK